MLAEVQRTDGPASPVAKTDLVREVRVWRVNVTIASGASLPRMDIKIGDTYLGKSDPYTTLTLVDPSVDDDAAPVRLQWPR